MNLYNKVQKITTKVVLAKDNVNHYGPSFITAKVLIASQIKSAAHEGKDHCEFLVHTEHSDEIYNWLIDNGFRNDKRSIKTVAAGDGSYTELFIVCW